MMCSTWKISVFGIVALMLSFGLTAGDAWAHSDGSQTHPAAPNAVSHFDDATLAVTVNSSVDAPTPANGNGGGIMVRTNASLMEIEDPDNALSSMKLRATEVLDSIVFTYTVGSWSSKGNIAVTIPGGWTQPQLDNNDGMHEAGEVTISSGTVSIGAGGGGWRITSGNYDPAPAAGTTISITYKRVTVPKRAGAYQFGFTSNVVGSGHVSQLDSHLNAHATQVEEGGHMHGDLGSLDFVPHHLHTGAWDTTIGIVIHSHDSDNSITHVSPHTHVLDTDTPAESDIKLAEVTAHAHSGANEPVDVSPPHTHGGNNEAFTSANNHAHGGNGQGVTAVSSHEHTADGAAITSIPAHAHSGATVRTHTHGASDPVGSLVDNIMIHAHGHAGDAGAVSLLGYHHTHDGDNEGVTSVRHHTHRNTDGTSPDGTTDNALETGGFGPQHTHTAAGGTFNTFTVPAHTHAAPANPATDTTSGASTITGDTHTHTLDPAGGASYPTGTSSAGDAHNHVTRTGAVWVPSVGHSHAADAATSNAGPAHQHATIAGGVASSTLVDHAHGDIDANASAGPAHEHTSSYSGIKSVGHHVHTTADGTVSIAGSPPHNHATTYAGATQAPIATHTHGDGTEFGTSAQQHTHTAGFGRVLYAQIHSHATVTGASSMGPIHSHAAADGPPTPAVGHSHDASGIAMLNEGVTDPLVLHTHTGAGVTEVPAHTHTGATVNMGVPHLHGATIGVGEGPTLPISAHVHATHMSGAGGNELHSHTADYAGVDAPLPHTHATDSSDSDTGISHVHTANFVGIRMVGAHTHATEQTPAGTPLHDHTGDFSEVERIAEHQHDMTTPYGNAILHSHVGSYTGPVAVPPAHSHAGGLTNHVAQNSPHLHSIDHSGRYVMNVGAAPSGSGSLAFVNTGSPRLAPYGVDGPYKDKYLVTKDQELGDLVLTYTAAGTMMKGSGIRITTNLMIDQGFYPYNAGGPGGGVVLERGSAMFAMDPVNSDADGISQNALYVKTTAGLEAGSQIGFRVRNLSLRPHGTDAGQDPTPGVADYTLSASSSSPLAADGMADLMDVGGAPTFAVTGAHNGGEVKLTARASNADLTHATAGEDLGTLNFVFNTKQPMATGSTVEIDLPAGWAIPFHATSPTDERSGATTLAGPATLVINGMKLTATTTAELSSGATAALTFTYKKITAPSTSGAHEFITRMTAGPHGTLAELGRIAVDIAGTHGAGSVALTRGGAAFRQAATGEALGNLVFTYTAANRMAKDAQVQITIPQGWTSPHEETADGVDSPGEVSISSGNANLVVTGGGGRPWKLTANTTAALDSGATIVFNYKSVTAPGAAGSYTFETHQTSFTGALHIDNVGARLASSPTVGVGQAPDGAGTMTVAKSMGDAFEMDATGAYLASAGDTLGNLTFTYTATGTLQAGGSVSLMIPEPWDAPSPDNGDGIATAGETSVAGAGVAGFSVANRVITATVSTDIASGNSFTITYKNINAPTAIGEYIFTAQSKSTSLGTPTNLSEGSPTIKVGQVPVGTVSLSTMDADGMSMPLMAAGPDMNIGDVTITYTATQMISAGAMVMVTIPAGWSAPNVDNNDGVDAAGEVSVTGSASLAVTGGGGQPWMLVATTNAALESGDMIVFMYKNVTTPSAEMDYEFTTSASISATSSPVPIMDQASVTIRAMVSAIAIEADDSVFAGESLSGMVTLWSGMSAANALGDTVVMLSSDSETGSFAADSVTIADNMPGAAFSYTDTAPGMVTLTATSGEMTATKEITVKSGVSGLSVDPALVKAGSDITVTATGKAGGGTVMVMDSEGMQVGKTKSLDPVIEPEVGDVTYSRTVTLPDDLADGMYTVSVDIQGLMDSMDIEVLNDQTPPALSGASVSTPDGTFMNGAVVTVTATATSDIGGIMVSADVEALDSTRMEDVALTQLTGTDIYTTIFTISDMNMAEDGDAMVTITATDRIGNSSMATVTVELDNVADDMLTRVWVEPDMPYKPGETAWIKAMGSEGAEASATVNDATSGMKIAQVTLDEMEGTPGTYVGELTIVEDAHPVGSYDVTVTLGNADPMTAEGALTVETAGYTFTLSIGAGTHLIHVPLDVNQVNGEDMAIDTVGDLYDALGDAVNFIISLGADGSWNSYLGDASAGTAADAMIGDDTGLIAVMKEAATLMLGGDALGTGGVATISLNAGNNLIGVPLDSAQIGMISDVLGPLVSAVVVSNEAGDGFNTIAQAGDPGDGALMGGAGYIVVAAAPASIPVIGSAWQDMAAGGNGMTANGNGASANGNGASAAPSVGFRTPVLQVQGKLIDATGMMSREGLNVSVKNLTSGVVLGRSIATDSYSMTFVKLDSNAAKIGDVLEIRADSPNPLLGIRPVQHVVTSEDVLNSRLSLPDLVTYEIPAQTELLSNYPNPFNPETWIPFRLAEDSAVSLSIYGASGSLVRTIDLGFTPAAVYEGRSDAIYWDGRNNFGEQVSSGIYFYHLNAGDFSATRKMVIVK